MLTLMINMEAIVLVVILVAMMNNSQKRYGTKMGQYTAFILDKKERQKFSEVCKSAVDVLDELYCPEYITKSNAIEHLRDMTKGEINRIEVYDEFFGMSGRYDYVQDIIDFFGIQWSENDGDGTLLDLDSSEMIAFAHLGKAVIEEKHHLFKDILVSAYCSDKYLSDMVANHYLNGVSSVQRSEDEEIEISRPELARIRRNEFIEVLGSNVNWDSRLLYMLYNNLVTSTDASVILNLAVVMYAVREACKRHGINYIAAFVC